MQRFLIAGGAAVFVVVLLVVSVVVVVFVIVVFDGRWQKKSIPCSMPVPSMKEYDSTVSFIILINVSIY